VVVAGWNYEGSVVIGVAHTPEEGDEIIKRVCHALHRCYHDFHEVYKWEVT